MSERVARLRIELQELEPKIWRRIDMPLSTTLEALHEAIQMTMGWTFSHLWEFDIDGLCYGDPSFREFDDEPPIYKAKGLRLGVVISRGVDQFVYTYDYGDNWRHDVIVEEVRDGEPDREYPAFVDGARRCPPEDVGGPDGFMDFLEAVLDPAHEQHRDMVRWYGGRSTRSASTRSVRASAWRTWCAGGAARWPVTGAGRGVENDDRSAWDGKPHRCGVFGPKLPSDAEGTQERS